MRAAVRARELNGSGDVCFTFYCECQRPPNCFFFSPSALDCSVFLRTQHDLFLRDKPNLLSEIRRATHYGVTPEKQEVDDLRSEVGSLRSQVTDMDGRIDALSRMVDRLLGERSNGGVISPDTDGMMVKHEIPSGAGWAKKRRLDAEWDGGFVTSGSTIADDCGAMVRPSAGPPGVKMEVGEEVPVAIATPDMSTAMQAKLELSESPMYQFTAGATDAVTAEASGGAATSSADGQGGIIIGGQPLCRDSSFMRELDNMSIGSAGSLMGSSGSLGPLELIDVTAGVDGSDNQGSASRIGGGEEDASAAGARGAESGGSVASGTGLDVLNESFFDLDFDAEITSMSSDTESSLDSNGHEQQQQAGTTISSSSNTDPEADASSSEDVDVTGNSSEDPVVRDQEARIEELTASLDAMPAESRRKLAEGLMALAKNPDVVSTLANGGAFSSASGIVMDDNKATPPLPMTAAASGADRGGASAAETPEIAMPLASAALGAFMVHYAQAQAVQEPAAGVGGVAVAVAMETSQHALKRTASSR